MAGKFDIRPQKVAVVHYEQAKIVGNAGQTSELQMLEPLIQGAFSATNTTIDDMDFVCSGSCDYLSGSAFAFVEAVEALGAFPPIKESHVEMDAAWALYETMLKIQCGDIDLAMVYGFGKSSPGELRSVLTLQLDPYYLAPLGIDAVSLAALQAQRCLAEGVCSEREMAEVVSRSRANAKGNPASQLSGDVSVEQLLAEPTFVAPLRKHDCPPVSDGASVMILASLERAKTLCDQPVVIAGAAHAIESSHPGLRDLTDSSSTRAAAQAAGAAAGAIEFAELYAPFSHQEIVLRKALSLADDVALSPSGGALAGNVMMASGLDRIGHAARLIASGKYQRGIAHATSGACLQQNLVAVLEAPALSGDAA